ncbi:MAG: OmpA family protein [Saprospiraceae bacterium]
MRFVWLIFFPFLVACVFSKKVRNAHTAMELKKYALATDLFIKEFDLSHSKEQKSELAYNIGDCFEKMSNYSNSLIWFKKSYELSRSNKSLLAYAYSLKRNESYKDAYGAFAELSNESVGGSIYRREANICKLANEWKNQGNPAYNIKVNRLEFCTEANEYAPIYDSHGKVYFSSDRLGSIGKSKYDWSGLFFSDIYQLENNREISDLQLEINTKNNEGTCSLNKDDNIFYFTRCSDLGVGDYYCQIYSKSMNKLKEPEELINLSAEVCNNCNPSIHQSDSVLIYSSDIKGGKGEYDLYISFLRNGTWTYGTNLGDKINTEGNEKFPVWNADTLYFSSDYLPGFGGLDIFKTWKDNNGEWVSPQRLEYPINSGSDDFNFSIDPTFKAEDSIILKALISSNRIENNGDDIFEVIKINKPLYLKTEKHYSKKIIAKINYFKTSAYSANLKEEPLDSISLKIDSEPSLIQTGNKNSITLELLEGQTYLFLSGRKGYLNNKLEIQTESYTDFSVDTIINLTYNIQLVPFEFNKEFLLENVYFDYDKAEIRNDAKPALDKLFELLLSNPRIKVQIAAHTDCRGEADYNLNLSEKRAKSVRDFLIQKGVNSENLDYKGFGESEHIIDCKCENCTEEQHQLNRRSTFRILH